MGGPECGPEYGSVSAYGLPSAGANALSLSGRYAPLPSGGAKLGKRQVIVKSNCKTIESCNGMIVDI